MSDDRVLVVGALGRMGHHVLAALAEHGELSAGAALEAPGHPGLGGEVAPGVVVGDDRDAALAGCDAAIVFAHPEGTLALLRSAAERGVRCVVGTTGFEEAARKEIATLAERIPIVQAANFSVAVNVLFHLTREAAHLLGDDFDAEIIELHHGAKIDAPSGTALRLGEAVGEGRGQAFRERAVFAREGITGARPEAAIGMQTLRGGDNPGEHTVMFIGGGERLELVHRSATRDHFARGAVRAAAWLRGRAPGLYDMEQVLGLGAPPPGGGTA